MGFNSAFKGLNLTLLGKVHREAERITSGSFTKWFQGRCPGPDTIPMEISMKDTTKRQIYSTNEIIFETCLLI